MNRWGELFSDETVQSASTGSTGTYREHYDVAGAPKQPNSPPGMSSVPCAFPPWGRGPQRPQYQQRVEALLQALRWESPRGGAACWAQRPCGPPAAAAVEVLVAAVVAQALELLREPHMVRPARVALVLPVPRTAALGECGAAAGGDERAAASLGIRGPCTGVRGASSSRLVWHRLLLLLPPVLLLGLGLLPARLLPPLRGLR